VLGKEGEARRSSDLAVGLQQGCTSLARGTAPAPWWSSRSMSAAVELEIDVGTMDPSLDPAPQELVHRRQRSRWCGYWRRPQGRRCLEKHGRARCRWGGPSLLLIRIELTADRIERGSPSLGGACRRSACQESAVNARGGSLYVAVGAGVEEAVAVSRWPPSSAHVPLSSSALLLMRQRERRGTLHKRGCGGRGAG
jgi:hypothetical protein